MPDEPKILIADNESNILPSLEFLMKKAGYDIYIARNGSEAMEILENNTSTLVVLDIMMPDIDSYQICKHIKATEKLKDVKVVFISANTKDIDIAKGLLLGANDYITKPFSTRFLMNRINELLNSK